MDTDLLVQESRSMLDRARELHVTCDEEYSIAGDFVYICKQLIAKIKAEFSEPKRKADEAHKAITALEKRTLEPVAGAMEVASNAALDYKREQERLAKEESEQAERERIKREEEERLREAERLDAEGKYEQADAILDKPIETPRPFKAPSVLPKVAGLSIRKAWKVRVVDPDKVERRYCSPNQTLINSEVDKRIIYLGCNKNPTPEQLKKIEEKIGGIEIFQEEVFAGRAR